MPGFPGDNITKGMFPNESLARWKRSSQLPTNYNPHFGNLNGFKTLECRASSENGASDSSLHFRGINETLFKYNIIHTSNPRRQVICQKWGWSYRKIICSVHTLA